MRLATLLDEWNLAQNGANTLRERIVTDLIAARGLVKMGSLASVGKNSANQSMKGYGPGSHTQAQEVDNLADLLGLYDQLKSKITCLFTADSRWAYVVPADFDFDQPIYALLTAIFTAMSTSANQLLPDISQLRLPSNLILQPSPVATW